MKKFKITKKEVKSRAGYVLLGVFISYALPSVQESINKFVGGITGGVDPAVIGIIGIILTFYFFDFE